MSSSTSSISDTILAQFTELDATKFQFHDMRSFAPATPISDRLFIATQYASAYTHQHGPRSFWKGLAVDLLTTPAYVVMHLVNMPIALGESLIAGAVGTLGVCLWTAIRVTHIFEKTQWPFTGERVVDSLEKYTVKMITHSTHSALTLIMLFYVMCLGGGPGNFHTRHVAYHEGIRLSSVFAVQAIAGTMILVAKAREEGKNINAFQSAVMNAGVSVATLLPGAFSHAAQAIRQDSNFIFRVALTSLPETIPSFDEFLTKYPAHRTTILNFTFSRLWDVSYRNDLKKLLIDVILFCGIFSPGLALNHRSKQEITYRNHLQTLVKKAVSEIYNDKTLSSAFGENDKEVREALESDANAIIAIACFTQLLEMREDSVICPKEFESEDLKAYNERRDKIIKTRDQYATFSSDQQKVLIQKLLKGSSFDLEAEKYPTKAIQDLYVSINELAAALHQGKLMSQIMINPDAEEMMGFQNLFAKGIQEAIKELPPIVG